MVELIRVVNIVLVVGCIVAFAPAIVYARDDTDRTYLIGTALVLAAAASGSAIHLHDPFGWPILVTIFGEILLLVSAWMSRRRRRGGGSA